MYCIIGRVLRLPVQTSNHVCNVLSPRTESRVAASNGTIQRILGSLIDLLHSHVHHVLGSFSSPSLRPAGRQTVPSQAEWRNRLFCAHVCHCNREITSSFLESIYASPPSLHSLNQISPFFTHTMPSPLPPPPRHPSSSSSNLEASPTTAKRPGLSRSNSSFTNFMNIRGMDRYGEDWGSEAMTLVGESFSLHLFRADYRCRRNVLWFVDLTHVRVRLTPDSRLDLINRRLKAQSARIKSRAVDLLPKGLRTPAGGGILLVEDDDEDEDGNDLRRRRKTGDKYRKEVEKEVERLKVKVGCHHG